MSKKNKKLGFGFMFKLRELGADFIVVGYEGSGDSGSIENVELLRFKDHAPEDMDAGPWDIPASDIHPEDGDEDTIKDYCYEKILESVENWYNNEGGYGTITINLHTGETMCYNHVNVMSTELYEHEFETEHD